jgi:hypothetical protein
VIVLSKSRVVAPAGVNPDGEQDLEDLEDSGL